MLFPLKGIGKLVEAGAGRGVDQAGAGRPLQQSGGDGGGETTVLLRPAIMYILSRIAHLVQQVYTLHKTEQF